MQALKQQADWAGTFGGSPDAVRTLAMKTLFERMEALCEGAIAVDCDARVVWINEKYARKLGLKNSEEALGAPVEDIIPNSQMREVAKTGQPIVVDIMEFGSEHLVVTRLPLRDDAGRLLGAIGFVLYDRVENLKPLMSKYNKLQAKLAATERELAQTRRAKYTLAAFLGISPAATEIKRQARRAAQLDTTVLLSGETGTGKELLAHAIHNLSPRADQPFVSVNAAAIPEALLEAELFGVAGGAYTGADRRGRDGKFKLADRGTLFLDEVGDMPLPLQAKLLRVLQEQEIEPLGSNQVLRLNVRVIAATSLDLGARVASGQFRADLYYRLNVLGLAVPPLRDRLEDLPLLTERLLEDIGLRLGSPLEMDQAAITVLERYRWPGNVRELKNVFERAVLMFENKRLTAENMAAVLPASTPSVPLATAAPDASANGIQPLAYAVADAERSAILSALKVAKGNKVVAAQALGISRAALYQKLDALGLRDTA